MNMEQLVEFELAGETEILGENSAPVPLHSPQILHDLTWDRTRVARLVIRRRTLWAMVWPLGALHLM
jgi:hypothetical protein